jgi:pimeloyl-ACP methyl ester carboxylesterase
VIRKLEAYGHSVVARDLPGLGDDRTASAQVTLECYADSVCEALMEESEPVLLVGHSMSGIVISHAAERMPKRIKGLVYISAYLLCDGESIMQMVQEDQNLARLAPLLISDGVVCTFPADKLREIFYEKCTHSDADWASSMLVPQPLAPFATPVHVTDERFGQIPRFYIRCLQDRAVPASLQERMLAATSCQRIVSMDTDHSPFLSCPDELAAHIQSFCS